MTDRTAKVTQEHGEDRWIWEVSLFRASGSLKGRQCYASRQEAEQVAFEWTDYGIYKRKLRQK